MNKKLTERQVRINAALRAYFKQHEISFEEIAQRMNFSSIKSAAVATDLEYTLPVIIPEGEQWNLPAGAFHKCGGPA